LLSSEGQDGLTSFAVVERLRFRGNDGAVSCTFMR
jgi:hypothetical protein